MKYVCTGRVQPERVSAWLDQNSLSFRQGGHATILCTGSQIITTLIDVPDVNDLETAYLVAKEVAQIFIGALGFSLDLGYSVEIVQVTDQNANTKIFGAEPLGTQSSNTPNVAPHPTLNQAAKLSAENVFFRRAIRDYLQAITDMQDGGFYCYRSIETIKSAFLGKTDSDQWNAMHLALGTDQDTIEKTVKRYADSARHGNWGTAKPVTLSIHNQMLRFTRDILVKYMMREIESE